MIPEELLPSPPIDLKQLCEKVAGAPNKSPQQLCDGILKGDTVDMLIPKIGEYFSFFLFSHCSGKFCLISFNFFLRSTPYAAISDQPRINASVNNILM